MLRPSYEFTPFETKLFLSLFFLVPCIHTVSAARRGDRLLFDW